VKRHYSYFSLFNIAKVRALLSFGVKGYLAETGWFEAFETRSAIDKSGKPLPWVTYSFIDFIQDRISKSHSIFEFGSGNSTLFYAERASSVAAVEHDEKWYSKMMRLKPENVELIFQPLESTGIYSRVPLQLNHKFDIIIIDGRDRVNCCQNTLNALSEKGVVVLDDSEREMYRQGVDFFLSNGFKHISFSGVSPGLFYRKATSVFYRDNNCLDI